MSYWMRFIANGGHTVYREKAGDDGDDGSGGKGDDGKKKKKESTNLKVELPEEVKKSFEKALDRADSAEAFAMKLFDENHKLRQEKRELQEKGADALSAKDKKDLDAYRELGTLDEVKASKAEHAKLKRQVEKSEKKTKSVNAAQILEWNAEVFAMMVESENLDLVIKNVKVSDDSDEKEPRVFVKSKGTDDEGNDTTVHEAIADWVKLNKSALLPSLEMNGSASDDKGTETKGHIYPAQRKTSAEKKRKGNETKGVAGSYAKNKYLPANKAS